MIFLSALWSNGFNFPSPIQLRAIPLAKSGMDLFIQAKSGTGKTLVFTVTILERFSLLAEPFRNDLTSLVIAPTREIVVQIQTVIKELGRKVKGFKVVACIGGTDVELDRKKLTDASCLVGTPGRVLHLIRNKYVNPENIELLVLDEADKLVTESFKKDVFAIAAELKKREQTLVVSATFDNEIEKALTPLMKNPLGITPKREAPILHGITQFIFMINKSSNIMEEMQLKLDLLDQVLQKVEYNQCMIFTNSQSRAESYSNMLLERGFVADFITGAQDQSTRLRTFQRIMVSANCRLIVTTDILARGIDAERVNVVINLELPLDKFCYLHRIGRAGRFGSLGIAISFVSEGEELMKFKNILISEEFPIYKMTVENASESEKVLETGTVPDIFEPLFAARPNGDEASGSNETSSYDTSETEMLKSKGYFTLSSMKAELQKMVDCNDPEEFKKLSPGVSLEEAGQQHSLNLKENPYEIFEVLDKFKRGDYTLNNLPPIRKLDEDDVEEIPIVEQSQPQAQVTRDILDRKFTLEHAAPESSNEPIEGSSSYKNNLEDSFSEPDSKGMFSTTTNFDSDSSHDNIGESEVNEAINDPGNLNTESINEKVDAFLEGLQDNPEDVEEPLEAAAQESAATVNGDISEAPDTVQEANNYGGIHVRTDSKIDSGSETDDEESFSEVDRDSNASVRGSNTFNNGIGSSDEEDYFAEVSHGQNSTQHYRSAYNLWTSIYLNQASQIQEYVNYVRYARQAASGRRQ